MRGRGMTKHQPKPGPSYQTLGRRGGRGKKQVRLPSYQPSILASPCSVPALHTYFAKHCRRGREPVAE